MKFIFSLLFILNAFCSILTLSADENHLFLDSSSNQMLLSEENKHIVTYQDKQAFLMNERHNVSDNQLNQLLNLPSFQSSQFISISQEQIYWIEGKMFLNFGNPGEFFPISGILQTPEGLYALTPVRTCIYGHMSVCKHCDGCGLSQCPDECKCGRRS